MRSRGTWRLYLGLALGLGVLAGVWFVRKPGDTVRYQGQTVRTWVLLAYAGTDARPAFAAMGPAAVPTLVQLLRTQEVPWQRWLRAQVLKLPAGLRQLLFGKDDTPTAVKLRCAAARCLGMLGPVMSASSMPTVKPSRRSAHASRAVTEDLPTPPFPLITATI